MEGYYIPADYFRRLKTLAVDRLRRRHLPLAFFAMASAAAFEISMKVSFRLPSTSISNWSSSFEGLARARVGHAAEHRCGVARQEIHEHLKAARGGSCAGIGRAFGLFENQVGGRFGLQSVPDFTLRNSNFACFVGLCRSRSARSGLCVGLRLRLARGFLGRRLFRRSFFFAALLLDNFRAQVAFTGEVPPVDYLECFFVFGICHRNVLRVARLGYMEV